MINYTNVRINCGERFPFPTQQRSPLKALQTIAYCDFSFGGRVTDVSSDGTTIAVTTETRCLGATDVTTYSGSVEDMQLILRLSGYVMSVYASEEGVDLLIKNAVNAISSNEKLQRPLYLEMASGLLMGERLTRLALITTLTEACYGQDDAALKHAIETSNGIKFDDLISAYGLSVEDGIDFLEAITLAAPMAKAA